MSAVPAFWQRPLRLIWFDLREVDARTIDPRRLVTQALGYGANALIVKAVDTVAWYPTRLPHCPVNEHMRGDFLGAVLREAHRQGLRVLAHLDLSKGHFRLWDQHPEWFQRTAKSELRREWGTPLICFQSPYWQERSYELVAEIMSRYPVDGLFVSPFRYEHCLCRTCQEVFRAQSGLELPLRENWDDPSWRAFTQFRQRQLAGYAERLRAFIRAHDPKTILALGFGLTKDIPRSLREGGWLDPQLAENVDLIVFTACDPLRWPHFTSDDLCMSEIVRLGRALGGGRPVCVAISYAEGASHPRFARSPSQLVHDLVKVVAHGGQPCVAFAGTFEQDDRKALPALETVYHYLRDYAAIYEALSSSARVALLYSQSTMDRYGGGSASERCLAEYRGLYEALIEGHIQFDVLYDASLTRATLKQYGLLVLPNVAVLSDQQAEMLDAFVEAGGRLIVTFETGLYDAQGQARGTQALRSLGRSPRGALNCVRAYLRLLDKGLFSDFEDTDLLPLNGAFLCTVAEGKGVAQVTDLYLVQVPSPGVDAHVQPGERDDMPGLVLSSFGLGEVAYLPWEIGRLYHQFGVAEYRQLVLDLVARAMPSPVITNAPCSVEMVWSHPQGDPKHVILHLINATGCRGKPLAEVISLQDISVWLQGDYRVARELRTGQDLALISEEKGFRFTVPQLDAFATVELLSEQLSEA